MNIKQYIESGVLENYVLGLVTEQERMEVEKYMLQYKEIKLEVEAIESALADYAQLHQVQPPSHIKAKVMQKIDGLSAITPTPTHHNQPLLAIIGTLLLLSGIAAFYYFGKHRTTKEALESVEAAYAAAQTRCDSIKTQNEFLLQQNQGLENQISFLVSESSQITLMKGTPKAPDAIAKIHWNAEMKQAFIDVGNMPAPAPGKQYQLWAIVDGKPVDMKPIALDAKGGGLIPVDFIENAQAFAITLEQEGGNPTPTLEEMIVIGNV